MELWKTISNCSRYEVSNIGRIRNKLTDKILRHGIDRYGYPKIQIFADDGKPVYSTIHRLVAKEWVNGCGERKNQVNHKDGNKENNSAGNLEWVTASDNIIHSFDNLLNENTNPVQMVNLETMQTVGFRSIKDCGRHIGIFMSVLVPLIRNSNINPVLGKFEIKLEDEERALSRFNTVNFGRKVYIFDAVKEEFYEYPSILVASYFTGIRSLSNITKQGDVIYSAGYYVSFDKEKLPKCINVNKDLLLQERMQYLNMPYRPRNQCYYLYDYYAKVEIKFSDLEAITEFLSKVEPCCQFVSKASVSSALGDGQKRQKTSLIKGYGLKSDLMDFEWFPYTEEVILCNKNRKFNREVYSVRIGDSEELIFGKHALCVHLGYSTDGLIRNITVDEITESSNIPNLCITRLNKPIS